MAFSRDLVNITGLLTCLDEPGRRVDLPAHGALRLQAGRSKQGLSIEPWSSVSFRDGGTFPGNDSAGTESAGKSSYANDYCHIESASVYSRPIPISKGPAHRPSIYLHGAARAEPMRVLSFAPGYLEAQRGCSCLPSQGRLGISPWFGPGILQRAACLAPRDCLA